MKYVYELGEIAELNISAVTIIMQVDSTKNGVKLHFDVDLYISSGLDGRNIELDTLYEYMHNSTLYCYLLKLYICYNDNIVSNKHDIDIIKMLQYKCDYSYD